MDGTEEIYYLIALSLVPGIGAKTGKALIQNFGSATDVFKVSLKELRHIEGIGEVKAKGFKDTEILNRARKEMDFVMKNEIRVLPFNTLPRLTACVDAPMLLYYKGTANLDAKKVVAIVGTRKNTDYGQKLCEDLVEALSRIEDVLIVSGLALGIDGVAHKKAVQLNLPTVGVLGHGLDRIYPFNHKSLAGQMLENGGLLTEFPQDTAPDKGNFPMRNRIVAGISDVTVVVESNIAGGALITALMASSYNREVAAYPGRVNDTRSAGCNEIIRTNIASMITKPEDLIELMNWGDTKKAKPVQRQLLLDLNPEEQKIVGILQNKDSVHADELMHQSGIQSTQLAATLLQLEMNGIVRTLPGKQYRLV